MSPAAASVDAYLDALPDDQRRALQRLREQCRAAAPDADEVIAYGLPGLRLRGRYLLGFGAARRHCAFYPGKAPIQANLADLTGFELEKGTIRFQPERPVPPEVVERIVRARVAERG
jgi:uncharacterized protein YdhG (YjbR/CyaY superfamily)